MNPYYSDGSVTIYHGDCRDVLSSLGTFDLLLTDPPYGLGEKVWGKATSKPGNKARWRMHHGEMAWDDALPDLTPILTVAPKAIIWGGQPVRSSGTEGVARLEQDHSELVERGLRIGVDESRHSHRRLRLLARPTRNRGQVAPNTKAAPANPVVHHEGG
jgi:hypothetical protein